MPPSGSARLAGAYQERAKQDQSLPERARSVLSALLEIAGTRSWCRPSVARLSDLLKTTRRTIFRSLADLERRGYIESTQPNGYTTTIRRFLQVTETAPESAAVSSESNLRQVPTPTQVNTCEGGRDQSEDTGSHVTTSQEGPGQAISPEAISDASASRSGEQVTTRWRIGPSRGTHHGMTPASR